MSTSLAHQIAQRRRDWRRKSMDRWMGLLLVLWILAFFDPLDLISSGSATRTSFLEQVSTSIRAGSLANQLLILALGAIGGVYFFEGARWLIRSRSRLTLILLAYWLWSLSTLAWSTDPQLTTRRIGELSIVLIASVGIGGGFYGSREDGQWRFMRDSLIIGLVAIGSVWLKAVLGGELAILSADWSLVRVGVATEFGIPIAFALLAALHARVTGVWAPRIPSSILTSFIFLASVTLVSLRKRTLLAGTIIIGIWVVIRVLGATQRRFAIARVSLGGAALLGFAWISGADPIEGLVVPVLTRGEQFAQIATLTGRVPLWDHLLGVYAVEHPFAGVGYGAFWSPETLDLVWSEVGWAATNAHNAMIEELLQTGAIGLILIVAFWVASVVKLMRGSRGVGPQSIATVIAAWVGLLTITAFASTTLQDWDQLVVIMPLAGVLAWVAWAEQSQSLGADNVETAR